jgi:hypothetical protein
MSEVEREPDWCIVRWHTGDLIIRREYQWIAQGKHYPHKWEYMARGFKSNEDALQWVSLFKE